MPEKFTARCLVAADCTAVMHEADCASIRASRSAAPHTAADCRRWQDLDRRFGTEPDSPLHHNNRCTAPEHVVVSRAGVGRLRRRAAIRPTNLPR